MQGVSFRQGQSLLGKRVTGGFLFEGRGCVRFSALRPGSGSKPGHFLR